MDGKKTLIIGLTGNMLSDQRMQRIAAAMLEIGWEVSVYYRKFLKGGVKLSESKAQFPYPTYALNTPFKGGMAFYFWFNIKLFLTLLFKRVHTYYAVDSDTLPCFILLSILRNKKLVFDSHEYFAEVPELQGKFFKKKIWHVITKIGAKRACLCLTVGPLLAAELERVYKKPFLCIRNVPVKQLIQTPVKKFERPVILYQGALNQGRMLESLIEAMRELQEFDCYLVGEGDLSKQLRKQAEGLSNIYFKGILLPEALKELTPTCFVGYNILDAGGSLSYYYSLSNKYFDYMHAGLPSVSSSLPEYEALNQVWHCGVCLDNDMGNFIRLMRSWLNSPGVYHKLKENAKFAAEQNHWEIESKTLKDKLKP